MNIEKLCDIAGVKLTRFIDHIAVLDGVDMNSLCIDVAVHSKTHPDLMSVMLSGDDFILQFTEGDRTVPGDKNNPTSPADILFAVNLYEEEKQRDEFIAKLISAIAQNEGVFVDSISVADLEHLQSCWSDAYGEDRLELFLHKINAVMLRGYIHTHLTKEAIAAKNNEDGPEVKNVKPMFDIKVPVCHIL